MVRQVAFRRTIIDVRIHILAVVIILTLAIAVVVTEVHRSMLRAWLDSALVIWFILSIYGTVLLWHGVRPDNGYVRWRETLAEVAGRRPRRGSPAMGQQVVDSLADNVSSFSDIWDVIIAVVVGIAVSAWGLLMLWAGASVLLVAAMLITLPVYYVFRRGLRLVLVQGLRCRHRLVRSSAVATMHAAWYAVSICAPLWMVDHLAHLR